MKKILTFLATFVLFASIANAQITVTSIEGTIAVPTVPFINTNADGWSQTIYTSDMIGGYTNGGTIYSISYNLSMAFATIGTQDVYIYMANTSKTKHNNNSDWVAIADLTQVYHNASFQQPTATGWFTITLDTPFEYTGGSLLICVAKDGTAAYANERYLSFNKVGTVTTTNASLFKTGVTTAPTSGTGSLAANAPNLKMTMIPNPSNLPPEAVNATTTASSLNLSWTLNPYALTADYFTIEYGLRGFTPGTGTVVNTPTNAINYTINGLEGGTWYDVYVKSVVSGSASVACKATLHTDFNYALLDENNYTWSFLYDANQLSTYSSYNINNELPLGWDFIGLSATNNGYPQAWASGNSVVGATMVLRSNNSASTPVIAILPKVNASAIGGIAHAAMSFNSDVNSGVDAGFITDPNDASSFVSVASVVYGDQEVDLELSNVTVPDNARLALRYSNSNAVATSATFKNINIHRAPACKVPTELTPSNPTTNGFTLSWNTNVQNTGDQYRIIVSDYGMREHVKYTTVVGNVTNYTITSLQPVYHYTAGISKICGGVETDTVWMSDDVWTYGTATLNVNNPLWGSITGNDVGNAKVNSNFIAMANDHYHFVNWTHNGNTYTTNPLQQQDIYTPEGAVLTANFGPDTHQIAVTVNNALYGSASITRGADVATAFDLGYGSVVTLSATPEAGHTFVGWSDGDNRATRSYVFSSDADLTLKAYFVPDGQVLAVANVSGQYPAGTTIVSDQGDIVTAGATVTFTLTLPYAEKDNYTVSSAWANLAGSVTNNGDGTYTAVHTANNSAVVCAPISPKSYFVSVNRNIESLGTVSGANTYRYGSTATVSAQPNEHRNFVKWTVGGAEVSTDNPYSFSVNGPVSITAVFNSDTFDVEMTVSNPNYGKVLSDKSSDRFGYGEWTNFKATAYDHYSFANWVGLYTVGGRTYQLTSTDNPLVWAANRDITWTAYFNADQIYVAAVSLGHGSVTPESQYVGYNTPATITAMPDEHYQFVQWDDANTDNPRTITVTSSGVYRALFGPVDYAINAVSGDVRGTVAGSGSYTYGTVATLVATANPGCRFVNWTDEGDNVVSTDATYSPLVNGVATYTAHFDSTDYTVSVTSMTGGNIVGGNLLVTNARYGHQLTVEVNIDNTDRYSHVGWSVPGHETDNTNPFVFTVTGDMNFQAIVGDATKKTATLVSDDYNKGDVSASQQLFANTEYGNFEAFPKPNYHFLYWSWNDGANKSSNNPLTTTIPDDITYKAYFAIDTHLVTVGSNNLTMGSAMGAGMYAHDSYATVTAVPAAGHKLINWTLTRNGVEKDTVTTTGNTLQLQVKTNTNVRANFEVMQYSLTIASGVEGIVSTSGSGIYDYGTNVNISATLADHYDWDGWNDNVSIKDRTVTVDRSIVLTPRVKEHEYTVSVVSDNAVMGHTTGNTTRHYNETVTVNAVAHDNYRFVRWSDDNTEATRTIPAGGDVNLTAYFEAVPYSITVNQPLSEGSIVLTAGDTTGGCVYGTALEFTAMLTDGVKLRQWNVNGNNYAVNPLNFMVTGNTVVSVLFDSIDYSVNVASNDFTMGSVTGSGTYRWHHKVTPVATANSLYKFIGWSDGERNAIHSEITVEGDMVLTAFFAEADKYGVAVVANNAEWGSAEADQTSVYAGTTVTLTATATDSTLFAAWSDNNTDNPREIVVTGDTVINAIFALKTYNLTVNAGAHGTLDANSAVSGSYDHGRRPALIAKADDNYHFAGWYDANDNLVGTASSIRVRMTSDSVLTARFAVDSYDVAVRADNATYSGDGTYEYGQTVTISVAPDAGYRLTSWEKNGVAMGSLDVVYPNSTDLVFSASENANVVVRGEQILYGVSYGVNNDAWGRVTMTESGVAFPLGTTLHMSASTLDANRYRFVSWNDGNENADTVLTVSGEHTLTAVFEKIPYNVTVVTENLDKGVVDSSINGIHYYGEMVTFEAMPAEGYQFSHWTNDVNGAPVSTVNPMAVLLVDDMHYTAHFSQINYNVTIASNNSVMGVVTGTQAVYHYGDELHLTAIANNPMGGGVLYRFNGWSDGSTSATLDTVVRGDINLTAIFGDADKYTVFVSPNNTESGSVTGSGSFYLDENITVAATPAMHHYFAYWQNSVTGDTTHANPYSFNVAGNTTMTAYFGVDTHMVSLFAPVHGTISGNGWYEWGSEATLTAVADEHYHLQKWTNIAGDSLSNMNPYVVTVTEDVMYSAVFAPNTYTLDVIGTHTQVTGGGDYTALTNAHLTAVADADYTFSHWTKDGVFFTSNPDTTFVVEGNATYEAISNENAIYNVLVQSISLNEGNVSGNGSYHIGNSATVYAVPALHYHFDRWENMGVVVSTNAEYTFTVADEMAESGDIVLTAYFTVDSFTVSFAAVNNGTLAGDGTYAWNSPVTVTATPAQHYDMLRWIDADSNTVSTAAEYTFSMPDSNVVLGAEFGLHTYTVSVSATHGTVLRGSGSFEAFTADTIVVEADADYHVAGWKIDGLPVLGVTSDTLFIASVEDDYTVEAIFSSDRHSFAFSSNDEDMGSVIAKADGTLTMGGMFDNGTQIELVARKHGSNDFVCWLNANDNTDTIGTDDTLTFVLTADTNIVAVFTPHLYALNALVPSGQELMGYTTGTGNYELRSLVDVTAVANIGHHFMGWSDGVATPERQIYVTEDTTIYANFAINTYNVTVDVDNPNGMATGGGIYNYGETARLVATGINHHHFVAWKDENGAVVSTANPYLFVVDTDVALTACFAIDTMQLTIITDGAGSVSITGEPIYDSIVILTAIPDAGHYFYGWSDGDTHSVREVHITSDTTFTAYFYRVGIEDVDMNDIQVYAYGNAIIVKGAAKKTVQVYDAVGRKVLATVAEGDMVRLPIDATGVFMVQVGNSRARRVMLMD